MSFLLSLGLPAEPHKQSLPELQAAAAVQRRHPASRTCTGSRGVAGVPEPISRSRLTMGAAAVGLGSALSARSTLGALPSTPCMVLG